MMKKYFVSILLIVCCMLFVGCGQDSTSIFIATGKSLYSFYDETVLTAQDSYTSDIQKVNANNKDKINYAWNGLSQAKVEERAIIASIECYNTTASPKELYLDGDNSLISVKQKGAKYICTINDGTKDLTYSFTITRNTTTSDYTVKYQSLVDDTKKCTANVGFNKSKSNLAINLTTYIMLDSTVTKLETYKNFYTLQNNHTAARFNIQIGSGNNSSIYTFNIYKQVVDFNLKIAVSSVKESAIDESTLSLDKFVLSQKTDNGGYIVKYRQGTNSATIDTFGNVSNW